MADSCDPPPRRSARLMEKEQREAARLQKLANKENDTPSTTASTSSTSTTSRGRRKSATPTKTTVTTTKSSGGGLRRATSTNTPSSPRTATATKPKAQAPPIVDDSPPVSPCAINPVAEEDGGEERPKTSPKKEVVTTTTTTSPQPRRNSATPQRRRSCTPQRRRSVSRRSVAQPPPPTPVATREPPKESQIRAWLENVVMQLEELRPADAKADDRILQEEVSKMKDAREQRRRALMERRLEMDEKADDELAEDDEKVRVNTELYRKLFSVAGICRQSNYLDGSHLCFHAVDLMLQLRIPRVYTSLLKTYFWQVVDVLEFHPSLRGTAKATFNHSEVLKARRAKVGVPLSKAAEALVAHIDEVRYLKDVMLAKAIDDEMYSGIYKYLQDVQQKLAEMVYDEKVFARAVRMGRGVEGTPLLLPMDQHIRFIKELLDLLRENLSQKKWLAFREEVMSSEFFLLLAETGLSGPDTVEASGSFFLQMLVDREFAVAASTNIVRLARFWPVTLKALAAPNNSLGVRCMIRTLAVESLVTVTVAYATQPQAVSAFWFNFLGQLPTLLHARLPETYEIFSGLQEEILFNKLRGGIPEGVQRAFENANVQIVETTAKALYSNGLYTTSRPLLLSMLQHAKNCLITRQGFLCDRVRQLIGPTVVVHTSGATFQNASQQRRRIPCIIQHVLEAIRFEMDSIDREASEEVWSAERSSANTVVAAVTPTRYRFGDNAYADAENAYEDEDEDVERRGSVTPMFFNNDSSSASTAGPRMSFSPVAAMLARDANIDHLIEEAEQKVARRRLLDEDDEEEDGGDVPSTVLGGPSAHQHQQQMQQSKEEPPSPFALADATFVDDDDEDDDECHVLSQKFTRLSISPAKQLIGQQR
eukprot:PhM_4_TR12357/c0_g1_i1/m.17090